MNKEEVTQHFIDKQEIFKRVHDLVVRYCDFSTGSFRPIAGEDYLDRVEMVEKYNVICFKATYKSRRGHLSEYLVPYDYLFISNWKEVETKRMDNEKEAKQIEASKNYSI